MAEVISHERAAVQLGINRSRLRWMINRCQLQGVTTPDTTTLSKCPLWIAEYGTHAAVPQAWGQYTLWQYTCTGKVSGVLGDVDRSYFAGDSNVLKALFE